MAKVTLTINEAKYLLLRSLDLQAAYHVNTDTLHTTHILEIIDGRTKLEEGAGESGKMP